MFIMLKRLFRIRAEEKPLSQKLLANILQTTGHKDYFPNLSK